MGRSGTTLTGKSKLGRSGTTLTGKSKLRRSGTTKKANPSKKRKRESSSFSDEYVQQGKKNKRRYIGPGTSSSDSSTSKYTPLYYKQYKSPVFMPKILAQDISESNTNINTLTTVEINGAINNLYEEMSMIITTNFIMNLLDLYLVNKNGINSFGIKKILFDNINNQNIVRTYKQDFELFFNIIDRNQQKLNKTIIDIIYNQANKKLLNTVRELYNYMEQSHNSHNFESAFELSTEEKKIINEYNKILLSDTEMID